MNCLLGLFLSGSPATPPPLPSPRWGEDPVLDPDQRRRSPPFLLLRSPLFLSCNPRKSPSVSLNHRAVISTDTNPTNRTRFVSRLLLLLESRLALTAKGVWIAGGNDSSQGFVLKSFCILTLTSGFSSQPSGWDPALADSLSSLLHSRLRRLPFKGRAILFSVS